MGSACSAVGEKDKERIQETKTFILEHRNGYAMILNENGA